MSHYLSDNITGGLIKADGTTYTMQEIRYGANLQLVWPMTVTYSIVASTVVLYYSSGTQILANATNYAFAKGNVNVYYINGTLKETLTNVTLTPSSLTGQYAANFRINGQRIEANNLGTTPVNTGTAANPKGYSCSATFVYNNSAATGAQTIWQQYNRIENSTPVDTYDDYEAALSADSVGSGGGSVTVTSSRAHYSRVTTHTWTSTATSQENSDFWTNVSPTDISATPSSGVTISGTTVTFPVNASTSAKAYTVTARYTESGVTYSYDNAVTVAAASVVFDAPTITVAYEYVSGTNYHIPCTGGTVYPVVSYSQRWRWSHEGSFTHTVTGWLSGGERTGRATDGIQTVTFTMSYSGANASYGGYRSSNLGTTLFGDASIGYGDLATISTTATGGGETSASVSSIIRQQANAIVDDSGEASVSYAIEGLNVAFSNGTRYSTPAPDSGAITYTSCYKKYKKVYVYTTGASKYSDDYFYTPVTPTFTTTLSGATVSGSTVTTTKRAKTATSTISGYLTASFGGTSSRITIYQYGTTKTYTLTSNYADGLALPAYALTVTPVFTAYTNYDNGDDPDATASPSVSFVSGSAVAGRITRSGLTISSVNLGTTPYADEASTTFTYRWSLHTAATTAIFATQAHNIVEDHSYGPWQQGEKVYGTPYQEFQNWLLSAALDRYAASGADAAPNGKDNSTVTATLTATATHEERTATPWTKTPWRTVTNVWTSTATSDGGIETNPGGATDGTDYGGWSIYSDISHCSASSVSSWLSVGALSEGAVGVATATVTYGKNTGNARQATISVKRVAYDDHSQASTGVITYQKAGNSTLSVSPTTLATTYSGGTYTFTVAAKNTAWAITYANDSSASPVFSSLDNFSPSSGGTWNTTTSTRVTVTVPSRPIPEGGQASARYATVYITSTEDNTLRAQVRVTMLAPN